MLNKIRKLFIVSIATLGALPGLGMLGNWIGSLGPSSSLEITGSANSWRSFPPLTLDQDGYTSVWDKYLLDDFKVPLVEQKPFYVPKTEPLLSLDFKIEEIERYVNNNALTDSQLKKINKYLNLYTKIASSYKEMPSRVVKEALTSLHRDMLATQRQYRSDGYWNLTLTNAGESTEKEINLSIPNAVFAVIEFSSGEKIFVNKKELGRGIPINQVKSGEKIAVDIWTDRSPQPWDIEDAFVSSTEGRGSNEISQRISGNGLFFGRNWVFILYWIVVVLAGFLFGLSGVVGSKKKGNDKYVTETK